MSRWASWILSSLAWFFVGVGTTILFFFGLFFLWPLSILFEHASGNLTHAVSQLWARMIIRVLSLWQIRAEGLERIEKEKPYVVVSNHQSVLDILVLLAKLPLHFKFIARHELFWIPFFGWHLALARYIPLKRGDPESGRACILKASQWLRRGVSVVFFPEGTRTPDGQIREFKAGAFKVALEEEKDILPVVIVGTREAIPKRSWRIENRTPLLLRILEPVAVKRSSLADLDSLREKIRSQIIIEFKKLKQQ